jgi:L-ascorbate metabolism protein UlaG (beta-lactamase superfamily)
MLINYHGHSEFLIETASGLRILTDPFDPAIPFPFHKTNADIVTVSHAHHDHEHLDKVEGRPQVIREGGERYPHKSVKITGLPSWHDSVQGATRGPNTIYLIQVDGLRLAHLGDLGCMPDESVLRPLEFLDLVFVPVGGTYTIDAKQAAALMARIKPRIIVPMHYKLGQQGLQVLSPLDNFLEALLPLAPSHQPLLRFTQEDISQVPHLVVLEVAN